MVTINQQAFLFLTCVKTGIMMAMLYDLIRVLRKIVNHPNWVVQVEDFLYWVMCGYFAFTMIYWRNFGQIRGFVFLGILIGGVLYFATVSKVFVKVMTKVVRNFVLIPIRCIIKTISIPIDYFLKIHKHITNKRKKQMTRLRHQLKVIKEKK